MAFADLLIELRTARGLSQEALAERTAVSLRAIGDLERGITRRPQRQTVQALADGLGLTTTQRNRFEEAARALPPVAPPRRPGRVRVAAPTGSIIGREGDLDAVAKLLRGPTARLVTVTGPGGVGKTRLAAEVAWQLAGRFARVDGVDLSPVRTPEDVPAALATALGARAVMTDPVAAIATIVGDDAWLLVLDSVEHVLDSALVLAELLSRCPRLRLLVTSRSPLQLRAEHLWPLAPLPVPVDAEDDLGVLGAVPAMRLLVERVRAVRPGFVLAARNASALSHLCRRLDGLPLAIELAAAHLRTLDPADLVATLDGQLSTLRTEVRDVPDRQQTLRATVEWSIERLGHEPRAVLCVLGAFVGGASAATLRQVMDRADIAAATLDPSVSLLVASSLVSLHDHDGTLRILVLDTIRDVAAALLDESGRAARVRHAHAVVFLELLRGGAAEDLDRVDAELGNVRAALMWASGYGPDLLDASVVEGFVRYCVARSRFAELNRVLAAVAERVPDELARAHAFRGAGIGANETGAHETAIGLAQRAAELFDKLDSTAGRCTALTLTGNAYKAMSDFTAAKAAYRTCLQMARTAGFTRGITVSLNNLGTLAHNEAEYDLARQYYQESLEVKSQVGDDQGVAVTLMNLGAIANDLGQYAQARSELHRALDIIGERGEPYPRAFGLVLLAEAQYGLGEYEAARVAATEGLRISREVHHEETIALALTRLGDLAAATDDERQAEALYREALTYRAGVPEVARTLERLACLRALVASDEARELLADAERMRRAHGAPVPPADAPRIDQVRRLLAPR